MLFYECTVSPQPICYLCSRFHTWKLPRGDTLACDIYPGGVPDECRDIKEIITENALRVKICPHFRRNGE